MPGKGDGRCRAGLAAGDHAQLGSAEGRRALRQSVDLTRELADVLLSYDADFRTARRDRTLSLVVERASTETLRRYAVPVAEGAAAGALWKRLGTDDGALRAAVEQVVLEGSPAAVRSIATWLLLDPLAGIDISNEQRTWIARQLLAAADPESRGLAAEAISEIRPSELVARAKSLVLDESERVRSHTWNALLRSDREAGLDLAIQAFSDRARPVEVRKSAMSAIARSMPTQELEGFFAEVVVDPDRDIALAAANIFQSLHRSPVIAAAAVQSPHEEVREIASVLMDPFRGSPAAGGSRPGDPTGGDVFAEMLRRLGNEDDETEP